MSTGRLDPAERRRALDRMQAGELDLLVVGGGVVGAGAALDAASRGLTVGLLERRDWAAGTSSRSSRLAHGGLRYLEQLEFGLVHEALTERGLLLDRLAPHLVRPVPFLLLASKRSERSLFGAGVAIYDVLSRVSRKGGSLPGHRHLSRKATASLAPGLDPDSYVGAVAYFDAQIDDARHTVALVRTAVAYGTLAASGVEVTGFLRDDSPERRVVGVTASDLETGQSLAVRARVVVGATGVWTSSTRSLLDDAAGATAPVQPSKGVHLVVPRDAIDLRTAVIARTPHSVLFLLPWGQVWLVGTTDTPWEGDRDEPEVTEEDVDYLLGQANRWLARPLSRDDIVGVFAGLRPLVAPPAPVEGGEEAPDTTRLSREHAVHSPVPGLVDIAGGKYTTYRVMARDVIDAAVEQLPFGVPPSRTDQLPLAGAEGFAEAFEEREFLGAEAGLDSAATTRLLRRYGSDATEVTELMVEDPTLTRRVHPDAPVLAAEVVHAASFEGARRLEDVLVRRTRLALVTRDGARSVAADVAALIAPVLGWDDARAAAEVAEFVAAQHGRPPWQRTSAGTAAAARDA